MGTLKVATYNVNSIRSRLHIVLPWLRDRRPDVLCMQETKVKDGLFPVSAFGDEGYKVIFRGTSQYNGVAIASREAAETVMYGLADGGPADEDRLIAAVFSGITIVNTYVPQGREKDTPHFDYKLEWFRRLRNFFDHFESPAKPLIWCGDLNVAALEELEEPLAVLFLLVGGLLEDGRHLLIAFLPGPLGAVGVTVPGLRLAGEGGQQIAFGFGALQVHSRSPLKDGCLLTGCSPHTNNSPVG